MFWIILGVVAWIALALWPANIAKRKGYSFWLFFILSILTSWLLFLIIALVIKDKTETPEDKADDKAAEEALEAEEDSQ